MGNFLASREEQLSESQLKRGYWWLTHKVLVRKISLVLFGLVGSGLVLYGIFGFVDWYYLSGPVERANLAQLTVNTTDYAAFNAITRPRNLAVDTPIVLASGSGSYDIVVRVSNPNSRWWTDFEYSFLTGSGGTEARRAFVLPGETKYVYSSVKADQLPDGSRFEVSNLVWHRVNPHTTLPDYRTWQATRLNFQVSDAKFVLPVSGDAVGASRATVTVNNDSGFGYRRVGFFILLLSGSQVVGASPVSVSSFRSGETRTVEATWFNDLPSITSVEVQPEVNIFDEQQYIPPGQ